MQGWRLNGPRTASVATAPLALGCKQDPCTILLSYLEQIVTNGMTERALAQLIVSVRRATGEPGSNACEDAPAALRRISSATNVETESTRKTVSATRKPVPTVRIAEASIDVTASSARNA